MDLEMDRSEVLLEFFKVLADEKRLQIVGLLARQDYSVEEQLTGEAEWGGVQILVYPMKADRMLAGEEWMLTLLTAAGVTLFIVPLQALSVHSGSDKFSIYGPMADVLKKFDAGLHIKTAGTTWLEAGSYRLPFLWDSKLRSTSACTRCPVRSRSQTCE